MNHSKIKSHRDRQHTRLEVMPDGKHEAHAYAERLRARLQELREARGLRKYGLARESGISREYIGKIERGAANPTLSVCTQLSYGLGMTLEDE